MKIIMKLLDSKKFIVTAIILNGVVMVFLVVLIFWLKHTTTGTPDSTPAGIGLAGATEEYEYTDSDDSLSSIYMTLLENTSAELENGLYYRFGKNGSYSGFFDANNPEVKDYIYKISADDNDMLLTIYNKEETQMVTYTLVIMDDGNMALDYPGFESQIVLSY